MKKFVLALSIFCAVFANSAFASVVIMGTRFVFPANDREISVTLQNSEKTPALMQVWFDDGNEQSRGENLPFNALPPVFKMQPNSNQTLRIIKTKANLPKDRESIFYLNILEIPPKPKHKKNGSNNYLQFAIRSRFKLFYRPNMSMARANAEKNISWRLVKKGSKTLIEANNKSPYFITLSSLVFEHKNSKYATRNIDMFKPFSTSLISIDKLDLPVSSKGKFIFKSINDFGGKTEFTYSN